MATKTSKSKGAPKGKKPPTLPKPPKPPKPGDPKCNMPYVCEYLEELSAWLIKFNADYILLRKAVCNVEKQAFSNSGINAKPPKFCSGGPGNEPLDPPKPPVW